MTNIRGDLTNVSAKKEPLVTATGVENLQTPT